MATRKGKKVLLLLSIVVVAILAVAGWLGQDNLRFWWLFEPLGLNGHGLPEYRHRQTGIVFVRLPGGKFWMGAQSKNPEGQNYDPDAEEWEEPVHEVTLSPFLIAKYEVSQAEWEKVMGNNPSRFKGKNLPMVQVYCNDCQEFCRKTGLSLPSEAQWEYACRAGTSGPYAGTGKLDEMGWYSENSGRNTHAVGQKMPNDFGLHDMYGNVWEWCEDVYEKYPSKTDKDPVRTSGSRYRVVRGGCWRSDARYCRSACRGRLIPGDRIDDLGFRPCYRISQ